MLKIEHLARELVAKVATMPYVDPAHYEALKKELDAATQNRTVHARTIEAAREKHATDEVEIDDDVLLSIGDEGMWVSAWVWIKPAAKTHCPQCGKQHFQIVTRQSTDIKFEDDGDHELIDGPYGDVDWDDDSFVICPSHLDGCGWSGQLKELV